MSRGPASEERSLLSVVKKLSFCRTVPDVMEVVRIAARELTGADGVTFVLREGDRVFYAEENAIAPLWKGKRFLASECISGWVMVNRKSAVIPDIYQDPRIPYEAYRPTFVQSLVMVPVRVEDPVAAIGAYWAEHHRAGSDEVETLQFLADATALALQNAELYSDLARALQNEREISRAKDQWLSTISHELRTPLTPIVGWVRMLLGKPLEAARIQEALRIIDRNITAHIRVVDDLLDVSRMLSGRFELNKSPVDIRKCVVNVVAAQKVAAETKEIAIEMRVPDEPLQVLGDSDRIYQVLWNLISNSIKFTPRGGRIDVSARRDGDTAVLVVKDNGEGMEPEALPLVFRRFHQIDGSYTRKAGGLGLGLWIVQQLVLLHDGTIMAASPGKGQGSTFTVRLPGR